MRIAGTATLSLIAFDLTFNEAGTRVPLALRWGSKVKGNRQVSDRAGKKLPNRKDIL